MKRFIAFVLLLMMLCTAASADVRVQSLGAAYCAAFSLDGQHCLMLEPNPDASDTYRSYIRHADGSVTDIVPTGLTEQDPPDAAATFERAGKFYNVQVCGNTIFLKAFTPSHYEINWQISLISGEATLLRNALVNVSGHHAAIMNNTRVRIGPANLRILDGVTGEQREQPIPEGVTITGACGLENGALISVCTEDGYALLWLDSEGNEVRRLACEYVYENLYYDEATSAGVAARNSMMSWSWFTPYMIMQMRLPELTSVPTDTPADTIAYLTSTQFYVSLTSESAKAGRNRNVFYPLGMTDDGLFLLNWNNLGWLCTLNVATLELTPLITANDNTDELMDLGSDLYDDNWNGGSLFCNPDELQPFQYVQLEHPALH